MKKRYIIALLIAAIVTLTIVGCSGAGGPSYGGTDYLGTWQLNGGNLIETMTWGTTSFSVVDTNSLTGTITCSVSYDDTGHIQMSTTSSTGAYSGLRTDLVHPL